MAVGSDSRVGSSLAGYRVVRVLGRGGMSVVYLAEDLALDRLVALKVMKPELSEDENFRERFRVEWRRAAQIEHPNVVPIYGAGEADGHLFIAMRYVKGTDLKALLESEGALAPERALGLVSQVAEGLDAAHNRGLVHRDVKPSNVLIGREGEKELAYLADFGLTKPSSSPEEARDSIRLSGTVAYVSPEQIAAGTADERSDIYALGAVLYEALTGEVPYPKGGELQALYAHVEEPPPRPTAVWPELPEAIDQVIARAMAKEPEQRYGSGAELAQAARAAFPTPSRPRWQLAVLVAVLAALSAAAIAIPAILLIGGDEATPGGTTEITVDSVQRIDPAAGELAATIPLEASADLMAAGEGSVWVVDTSERLLVEVDPGSNEVVSEVSLAAAPGAPTGLHAGAGGVWTNYDVFNRSGTGDAGIWLYDPAAGSFAPAAVADEALDTVFGVGHGQLWGERLCELRRVPPHAPSEVSDVGVLSCGALAFSDADAWVLGSAAEVRSGNPQLVWRVDPVSGDVSKPIELPGVAADIAADDEGLWLTDQSRDILRRVDRTALRPEDVLTVRSPEKLVVAAGSIWITNSRDSIVYRVDPESLDVESVDVGGVPVDIAADENGVWVTVRP